MTSLAPIPDLAPLLATLRRPHEPEEMMQQAADWLQQHIGHRLFTILLVCANREDTVRVYSDNLASYPINRLKRMGVTPWGDQVIHGGQSYVGYTDEDMRWAFPDHELIRSLGLSSSLNVPIVYKGVCLAVLNLQDVANFYRPDQARWCDALAPLLIPAMLELQSRHAQMV